METSREIADITAKVKGLQATILLLMQYNSGDCDRLDSEIIDNLLEGLQLQAADIADRLDSITVQIRAEEK